MACCSALDSGMVLDCSPGDFSLMGSTPNPQGKEQVLLVKMAHGRTGRAGVLKAEKDFPNGGLRGAGSGSSTIVSVSV